MPVRLSFAKMTRLLAVLMLATIGLQAVGPVAASLQHTHGSAFSAITYEVTLATQRTSEVRKAVVFRAALPLVTFAQVPLLRQMALPVNFAPRPDSTGPPLHDAGSWEPSPRAPPLI